MLIMVVDDERWARKDLIRAIRQTADSAGWAGSEQVAAEEAANGEEAWKMIKRRVPDVLVTDIRMPGMDGLQLIALVKQHYPHVACIIASGYDDFEYAKLGIKYGVKEYLLKPVREADLSALLHQLYQDYKSELRRKLYQWLSGKSALEGPQSQHWQGRVAILAVLSGNWHSGHDLCFADNVDGYQCRPDGQLNMVIYLQELPPSGSTHEARRFAQDLAAQWLERSTAPMVHVAYELAESWNRLPDAYASLHKRLQAALQLERRQIVHPEWQPADAPDMNEIWNRVRIVEQALQHGTRRELKEKWEIVFSYIQRLSPALEQLKTMLIDMIVGVYFHLAGVTAVHSDELLVKQREIDAVVTYAELHRITLEWLEALQDATAHLLEGKSAKQLLPVIVKDLQSRYAENIRLKEAAEAYGLHPSHLSRLFKEEYGMNFIDFMGKLRMQKAKELLQETALKPSEIAELVGFSDAKYFGFWFVKMTGMSPSAYRKSIAR